MICCFKCEWRHLSATAVVNTQNVDRVLFEMLQEVAQMKSQQSGSVNVEVDTPCSVDLQKLLDEVREQYQNVVKKNKQDLEKWFQSKVRRLHFQKDSACQKIIQKLFIMCMCLSKGGNPPEEYC